jgi:hypothetical protein
VIEDAIVRTIMIIVDENSGAVGVAEGLYVGLVVGLAVGF